MSEIEKAIETLRKISDIETSKRYRELHEIKSFNYDLMTAIEALQEKLEQENPQPLGLEELEKLVDEPVWVDTGEMLIDEQIVGCYEILERVTQEPVKVFWFTRRVRGFLAQDYGKTWLVYRYEPKCIEHIGEATNMAEGE